MGNPDTTLDLATSTGTVLVGSCLDRLKDLDDASIDSIVTDPPYEIGFMGKGWDSTGIAYSVELWAECLRVLKPGGHLLAFGATRSYHRMACAIEDSGFEIRDSIHWTYGSGFPKSHNIGKALDKAAGAEREVIGMRPCVPGVAFDTTGPSELALTVPATDAAKQWDGWGTALKPSHEPIVVARKPLVGTVAGNVLAYGTGALNIGATRVGSEPITINGQGNDNMFHGGFSGEVGDTARVGRWPANTVLTHNADCQQTGTSVEQATEPDLRPLADAGATDYAMKSGGNPGQVSVVWACTAGCPCADLDQQSGHGTSKAGGRSSGRNFGQGDSEDTKDLPRTGHTDSGGASRFFTQANWDPTFDQPVLYYAKPSKRERNAGLDKVAVGLEPYGNRTPEQVPVEGDKPGSVNDKFTTAPMANVHPTVKPVALMRHLIRLVTPPGGTVLDPFLGSGTTAVAAILEGFTWVGCELTDDYLPIIKGRVTHAEKQMEPPAQLELPL